MLVLLRRVGLGIALFAAYDSFLPFTFYARPLGTAVTDLIHTSTRLLRPISVGDFAANVLLFVPIGFCYLGVRQLRSPSRSSPGSVAIVIAVSASYSLALEFGQQFIPWRTATLTDVEAATVGTVLGTVLWRRRGLEWMGRIEPYRLRAVSASPLVRRLTIYAGLYVAAFLVPLDVTIRPYDLLTKYVDGRLVQARIGDGIWAAHPFLHVAMNALVATPLGVLAVVGWTPHPRRVRQAMTLGFLALCGLGFAQVFVMSRSTDLLALLVGFCGLALGAAIARTFAPPLESGPPVKM